MVMLKIKELKWTFQGNYIKNVGKDTSRKRKGPWHASARSIWSRTGEWTKQKAIEVDEQNAKQSLPSDDENDISNLGGEDQKPIDIETSINNDNKAGDEYGDDFENDVDSWVKPEEESHSHTGAGEFYALDDGKDERGTVGVTQSPVQP